MHPSPSSEVGWNESDAYLVQPQRRSRRATQPNQNNLDADSEGIMSMQFTPDGVSSADEVRKQIDVYLVALRENTGWPLAQQWLERQLRVVALLAASRMPRHPPDVRDDVVAKVYSQAVELIRSGWLRDGKSYLTWLENKLTEAALETVAKSSLRTSPMIDLVSLVTSELAKLSAKSRQAIALVYNNGYSEKEAAAKAGIDPDTLAGDLQVIRDAYRRARIQALPDSLRAKSHSA